MTIEEVYEYTYSTAEVYSNAVKAKIASSMLVDGVTTKKKAEAGNKIYVGDRGDENTLIYCLKHNLEQITKYIELWEFIKNYKYSLSSSIFKSIFLSSSAVIFSVGRITLLSKNPSLLIAYFVEAV